MGLCFDGFPVFREEVEAAFGPGHAAVAVAKPSGAAEAGLEVVEEVVEAKEVVQSLWGGVHGVVFLVMLFSRSV